MDSKPAHLSAEYAAQFDDASVVAAYANRPRYPDDIFDALMALLPSGSSRVLELGAGTGDLTLRLAPRVASIDAVEPSERMLECARSRAGAHLTNVRWIHAHAEEYESSEPYALVVAAESIHWMDWTHIFSMIARWLRADAMLAIVTERKFAELPWLEDAKRLVAQHSTNREYRTYDVIDELTHHNLFQEVGRRRCSQAYSQSITAYIESFHSRNGLSRDRMSMSYAAHFDVELRKLVLAHAPTGHVSGSVEATIVWGRPIAA